MNKIKKNHLSFKSTDATKLLLAVIFIVMVFLPLIRMFLNISAASVQKVVRSANFFLSIKNSLVATSSATIIASVLAYFLARCTERINIKWKGFFSVVFVLPMLIPSISHGMGLIFLFGNNGIFTHIFGFDVGIYGLTGIIVGSVLYSFPVAYLMFADVMKYQDSTPYEVASVLGIPRRHVFSQITFPYFRKPLISILFATFTIIVTDYGVPLMIGGKYTTIPVVMYQEVIGQLDFGKGAVYGCLLLLPAVVAFIIDAKNKDKGNIEYITKPFELIDSKGPKIAAYALCIATSICTLLPVFSFAVLTVVKSYPNNLTLTLDNVVKTFDLKAGTYLLNSLEIALLVAAIGVIIAFLSAYMAARMKSKTSRFLHLAAITSIAIPGIVLGLSYVLTFKATFLYGTIIILVMVNIVHFISSPYLMLYNSFSKLNENLESVGQTLGISRFRIIKDVIIPSSGKTIAEMFSYFFVNCMMTISAVAFLSTTANKPIALMINQFEGHMLLECAAVVSLIILFTNLCLKSAIYLLKKKCLM